MNSIQLKAVSFSREQPLFEKTNLAIPQGTFSLLIGDSGSGKSTLLRLIAGFAPLDYQGEILIEGMERRQLSTREKAQKIGMLFQNPSQQFTMKTLERELIFALENLGISPEEMNRKIQTALQLVQTQTLFTRELATLSGGEKQKAALTVLLAMNPDILLLDEPLGALDLKLRQEMQRELKNIQQQLGITFIFVTHDQEEALSMSDTIVVMNKGKIQQMGTPEDIYNEPENAFVARFIGESNIMDGIMHEDFLVEFCGRNFDCVDKGFEKDEAIEIVIRPEDIKMVKPEEGMLKGEVTSCVFKGVHYEMTVESCGLTWLLHNTKSAEVGSELGMDIYPEDIHIMKKIGDDESNE